MCDSLLQSDLFIMQSELGEKKEELLSPPDLFMMNGFHVQSSMAAETSVESE